MRLLVVGATGRLGREIVRVAGAEGHGVRALARTAGAADWPAGVEAWPGDVLADGVAEGAMEGVDAVVVALSMVRASDSPWARILTPLDLHVRAAERLTSAARTRGVRRYLTVSAQGVGASAARAGTLFLALVRNSNVGVAYADLARAEAVVRASGLDWTIVRPPRLTVEPPTGRWCAGEDLVTTSWSSLPRADVAAFLVEEAARPRHLRAAVTLTRAP